MPRKRPFEKLTPEDQELVRYATHIILRGGLRRWHRVNHTTVRGWEDALSASKILVQLRKIPLEGMKPIDNSPQEHTESPQKAPKHRVLQEVEDYQLLKPIEQLIKGPGRY